MNLRNYVRNTFRLTFFVASGLVTSSTMLQAEVESLDSVAAIVNDDVILLSEIQERYANFLTQTKDADQNSLPPKEIIVTQILDQLVLESIQLQEAALRGVVIDDEDLNESAKNYAAQVGMSLDDFRARLAVEGVTFREFRDELRRQMTLGRIQNTMVNRRMFITERDIQEFRNSPFFAELSSEEYRLGHILLAVANTRDRAELAAARERAEQIVAELRDGADFKNMAATHSAANTALDGGDLGWRKASQIPSLFSEAVVQLEIGETADPFENSLGLHIVQLLEKKGASTVRGQTSLVRHILIAPSAIRSEEASLELVRDLKARLDAGASFDALAEQYSDDPGSALAGGDLGWSDGSGFVSEFQDAMTNAEVGVPTAPFQSDYGWHILEVQDRKVEDLSEEALDDLAARELYERRFDETLQSWLKEIRDEAFVKIVHAPI